MMDRNHLGGHYGPPPSHMDYPPPPALGYGSHQLVSLSSFPRAMSFSKRAESLPVTPSLLRLYITVNPDMRSTHTRRSCSRPTRSRGCTAGFTTLLTSNSRRSISSTTLTRILNTRLITPRTTNRPPARARLLNITRHRHRRSSSSNTSTCRLRRAICAEGARGGTLTTDRRRLSCGDRPAARTATVRRRRSSSSRRRCTAGRCRPLNSNRCRVLACTRAVRSTRTCTCSVRRCKPPSSSNNTNNTNTCSTNNTGNASRGGTAWRLRRPGSCTTLLRTEWAGWAEEVGRGLRLYYRRRRSRHLRRRGGRRAGGTTRTCSSDDAGDRRAQQKNSRK